MKQTIYMPAPELSTLKVVNIDPEMTGKHYCELASTEGEIPEVVALSIVNDLMDEDANKLTLSELRYLFTMVKIYSMENNYTVEFTCTHTVKGKVCGAVNSMKMSLSDADLNRTPKKYKVPTIDFIVDGKERKCRVMPPEISMEIELLRHFVIDKGIPYDNMGEDKVVSVEYGMMRALLHLVDDETGERVFGTKDFDSYREFTDVNKYTTISKLFDLSNEVDSYGVQPKDVECKCKECGGTLVFRLPLLHGLVG